MTPEKKTAFLAALGETCSVTKACKAVALSRETVYGWRKDDPAFAKAWEEAKEIGIEALEDECMRRAHEGFDKPIFHQGVECGTIREYSDTLAIFLLKGGKPDKYRERQSIEHQGGFNLTVTTGVPDPGSDLV